MSEKEKELFDFLSGVTTDQSIEFFDNLSETERKKYHNSRYMLHRFLSMNAHYLPVVSVIQKYTSMPDRNHYQFLSGILPRGKQYNKYIKGNKEDKYEKWLVELVSNHFNVSKKEATQYIEIYYKHNKEELKQLCEKYGIDKKLIKKAKL
jgi:hypothetical protein